MPGKKTSGTHPMRQTRLLPLFLPSSNLYIRERRKATLSLTDIFPFKFPGKRCSSSVRLNVPSLSLLLPFYPRRQSVASGSRPCTAPSFSSPSLSCMPGECVCRGIKGKGASSIESENAPLLLPLLPFSTTSTATLSLSLSPQSLT